MGTPENSAIDTKALVCRLIMMLKQSHRGVEVSATSRSVVGRALTDEIDGDIGRAAPLAD